MDVQEFFFSMLSVNIANSDETSELLQSITTLWITIKGYSMAGTWMVQYKKENTGKKKALRKSIKQ